MAGMSARLPGHLRLLRGEPARARRIALALPCRNFGVEDRALTDAPIQALSAQHADHVSTSWQVWVCRETPGAGGFGAPRVREGFVKRAGSVGPTRTSGGLVRARSLRVNPELELARNELEACHSDDL
jgi:hypothetical protein